MIDRPLLLADLKALVTRLEGDIRERAASEPAIDEALRREHAEGREAGRTAAPFEAFRDDLVTQSAVAWVLGGVFIRFLEDNSFLDEPDPYVPGGLRPRRFLSGATGELLQFARDHSTAFFEKHPAENERAYFFSVFQEIAALPGMRGLYDEHHNLLWRLPLSGDGARGLLEFWRKLDPNNSLVRHDFTDPENETRFLGDLYQDLSAAARDRYALLQTPDFVEEFILDRTLEPAIAEFGYQAIRLIDPTCGSGHFLLGAFRRLLERWTKDEPGTHPTALAQRALDGVYGVDLNPFATAIARFRLLIATLRASGVKRLAVAPGFRINVASGDSLLHGPRFSAIAGTQPTLNPNEDPLRHVYLAEDRDELRRILGRQYHAVVGNPPYITVKDRALGEAYRLRYSSCHRQYSLAVPFMERFFELAIAGRATSHQHENAPSAGFVGMITSNSFMKREFGKKLIEGFIPRWDITHVIDTSGAYLPGHGTPTVILFGRNRAPGPGPLRAVMGIRGEAATPEDPSRGLVWTAITAQVDRPGSVSEWVSVSDAPRSVFCRHPWSIGGGGAAELKGSIEEACDRTLKDVVGEIGFVCMTRADDVYFSPRQSLKRAGVAEQFIIEIVEGEVVRDWAIHQPSTTLFPYDSDLRPVSEQAAPAVHRLLWPHRTALWLRREPNGNHREIGLTWYEWSRFQRERFTTPLSIAFAFVATHNHFVLDRGGKVFNRTAPVIKLPAGASEQDHLGLLGMLNSSTACFWMKQTLFPKATATGDVSIEKGRPEANRYEFAGTALSALPLCSDDGAKRLSEIAGQLVRLAVESTALDGEAFVRSRLAAGQLRQADIEQAEDRWENLRRRMVALQEDLDWVAYRAFGLTELEAECGPLGDTGWQVEADQRPFLWSEDDGPALEPAVARVYRRRHAEIQRNPNVALIETPVFKRPWLGRQGVFGHETASYRERVTGALRSWLLDRLAGPAYWPSIELQSCARVGDHARSDSEFMQVAELYRGRADFDVLALVTDLVEAEAVPFLPVLRYKESGLRKRDVWERTWGLQRREDAGENVGAIEVPPKYTPSDFVKGGYWRLRGSLDVPKEAFVSYPGCSRAADPTLVVGWTGWSHLQQARALGAYYLAMREQESWEAVRLAPLLAGILELLPWIMQWHNAYDAEAGMGMGDYFKGFVQEEARALGVTIEALRSWRPEARVKAKRAKGKGGA